MTGHNKLTQQQIGIVGSIIGSTLTSEVLDIPQRTVQRACQRVGKKPANPAMVGMLVALSEHPERLLVDLMTSYLTLATPDDETTIMEVIEALQ